MASRGCYTLERIARPHRETAPNVLSAISARRDGGRATPIACPRVVRVTICVLREDGRCVRGRRDLTRLTRTEYFDLRALDRARDGKRAARAWSSEKCSVLHHPVMIALCGGRGCSRTG